MGTRTRAIVATLVTVVIAVVIISRLRTPQDVYEPRPAGSVTWRGDVATILHTHCVDCHRPGQSGPFDLLTYADAESRARQIAKVTQEGLMPPWLPSHGEELYAYARKLNAQEIGLLGQWAADGAPEGEEEPPELPRFESGWQIGEPDLVLSMSEAYELAADGRDVYRNFLLPVTLTENQWVESFEIRPSNPRVVHHVIMYLNDGTARAQDSADPQPGFDGMERADGGMRPNGHFLSWQPGRTPLPEIPGAAWQLSPGTDLLLQTHMQPSGKPEQVQLQVAFRFAKQPPERQPIMLSFMHSGIFIPAGEANYEIRMDYELPMDIHAYGVLPHLHYLGKQVRGYATLPNGSVEPLLDIPQWDFNWQSEYRFREPISLPAGTVITQHYSYDNSADNPRNPFDPPQRVRYGADTTDEMGEMWLQVVPDDASRGDELLAHNRQWNLKKIVDFKAALVAADPTDVESAVKLAEGQYAMGNWQAARASCEFALTLDPKRYIILYYLGDLLARNNELAKALVYLERAALVRANEAQVHNMIGDVHNRMGNVQGALAAFSRAIQIDPNFGSAFYNAGITLFQQGNHAQAETMLNRAVDLMPNNAQAWADLGGVRANMGRFESAAAALERALILDPSHASAANNLRQLRAMLQQR